MTPTYYFGYGSNLHRGDWQRWCCDAERDPGGLLPLGPAWLPDQELAFVSRSSSRRGGVLGLRSRPGQATAGWVYRVTDAGWDSLDSKEGAPTVYRRRPAHVLTPDGRVVAAHTYDVVRERRQSFVAPAAAYLEIVREGRAQLGIADDGHLSAAAANSQCPWLTSSVFVYGTCRPGQARFDVLEAHTVQDICPGTVHGMLVDLGAWPGLVCAPSGTSPDLVHGEVVTVADPAGLLKALDVVEGFEGWATSTNLFTRTLMPVQTGRGVLLAWAYRYAGSDVGAARIESGDWLDHGHYRLDDVVSK